MCCHFDRRPLNVGYAFRCAQFFIYSIGRTQWRFQICLLNNHLDLWLRFFIPTPIVGPPSSRTMFRARQVAHGRCFPLLVRRLSPNFGLCYSTSIPIQYLCIHIVSVVRRLILRSNNVVYRSFCRGVHLYDHFAFGAAGHDSVVRLERVIELKHRVDDRFHCTSRRVSCERISWLGNAYQRLPVF